jgi:hypothetical protein
MRPVYGNRCLRRGVFPTRIGKKEAVVPHDQARKASDVVEFVTVGQQTEDQNRTNKSECPLWNSFAAAREDGVRTTEAFLEALRAQTLFALRAMK